MRNLDRLLSVYTFLFVFAYFLPTVAYTQTIEDKTANWQKLLLVAVDTNDRQTALPIISANHLKIGAPIHQLLQDYLQQVQQQDTSLARLKLETAKRLAQWYNDSFEQPYHVQKVALYASWTPAQIHEKLWADSVYTASARAHDNKQYETAVEMAETAATMFLALNDREMVSRCNNSIGLTYFRLNDFPQAETFLKQSLKTNREIKLHSGVIANLNNLATLYKAQYKYQQALQAYDEVFALTKMIGDSAGLAAAWFSAGSIHQGLREYEKAAEYYDRAVAFGEKNQKLDILANGLNNKGSLVSDQSRYAEALAYWQRGLTIARTDTLRDLEATILLNMSIAYRNTTRYDSALVCLKQAAVLHETLRQTWSLANTLREMGIISYYKGQPDSSVVYWNKSIEVFKSIPDWAMVGVVTGHLGVYYKNAGRPFDALKAYEEALQRVREVDNRREEGNILGNMANVYSDILADYAQAEKLNNQALKIKESIRETSFVGIILHNLGILAKKQGKYQSSLEYYQRALKNAVASGDSASVASLNGDIGSIYAELDELETAVDYYKKELQILDQVGKVDTKPEVLINLGSAYLSMDSLAAAEACFRSADSLALQLQQAYSRITIKQNFGKIYAKEGKDELALQALDDALKAAEAGSAIQYKARVLRTLASFHADRDEIDQALDAYEISLRLARRMQSPEDIWRALAEIGAIHHQRGENEKALAAYKESIETIEGLRAGFTVESLKRAFMEERLEVYERIVLLLLELGREQQAFEYLEKAKARNLLDILSAERSQLAHNLPEDLSRKKTEMEYRLRRAYQMLSAAASQDPAGAAAWQDSVAQLRQAYVSLEQEIELSDPRYAQMTGVTPPLAVDAIQKSVLPPNSVLIAYLVSEKKTCAFVVTRDKLISHTLEIGRGALQAAVDTLLHDIRAVGSGKIRNFAEIGFNLATAHSLYRQLIQPLEAEIPAQSTLIIIPDGVLHYLPFEALVTEQHPETKKLPWYKRLFAGASGKPMIFAEYQRADYLIEKYPISYAPSASVLDPAILHPGAHVARDDSLAIFASPDFSGADQDRFTSLLETGVSDLNAFILMGPDNIWQFAPLQKTARYAREMAQRLPSCRLFLGPKATEATFKQQAKTYRYLHIATHAVAEERMPMFSRIVFAQNGNDGEDGFLHAYEILDLTLDADLVALIGCRTGVGKLSRGEGLLGLTQAFMYAGVPSVVVSLWAVEESSGRLMPAFYENLKKGMGKVEALQRTKVQMLDMHFELDDGTTISAAHPFLWAPFVLLGESR